MHNQNSDPELRRIFDCVDKDRSGLISITELQQCLSNGTWEPFNSDTVKLLMAMFDKRNRSQIDFEEFKGLWKYVNDWQGVFKNHDRDQSGSISKEELQSMLTSMGYRLSPNFYDVFIKKFDRQRKGVIYFDDFIQCLISLSRLTDEFRKFDTDCDGYVNFAYEQFLTSALCLL